MTNKELQICEELKKIMKILHKKEMEVAELRSQKWKLVRKLNPEFANTCI